MTTATAIQEFNKTNSFFQWSKTHDGFTDRLEEFEVVLVNIPSFSGYRIYRFQLFIGSVGHFSEADAFCKEALFGDS